MSTPMTLFAPFDCACESQKPINACLHKKVNYLPISQVTHPSLHPTSSTRAPANRAEGKTASLGSFANGRLT